jgi:pimeloyl-ACP methyl ester carboxylesterase
VTGGKECLVIKTYRGADIGNEPNLIVVLHGNASKGGPATFHYAVAQALAVPNVVAVAMIRPGYYGETGHISTGSDLGRNDNYTAEVIDNIADAVRTLKDVYKPRKVIMVGHSGGAAIAAVTLGRFPRLINGAVLVGCPCGTGNWRIGEPGSLMAHSENAARWVERIPGDAHVAVLVGSDDTRTPPFVSERYVALLKARGIAAILTEIPQADHDAAFRSRTTLMTALELIRP